MTSTTFEIETGRSQTVSEVIAAIAAARPTARALVFLEDGEQETEVCTYEELHCQARKIACALKNRYLAGERVLLMFHSGIDYVTSFLGCLYAGVIAVPLYPPRNNWHSVRAAAIARDAGAKAILTMEKLRVEITARMRAVNDQAVDGGMAEILAVDGPDFLSSHAWVDPALRGSDLAYLQYTSGSTSAPRGVMVSHHNLLRNCAIGVQASDIGSGETFVSWLPIFHDMGLVQGMMMPLTLGGTAILMPPAVFIQKPVRWLRAISHYRAGFSSGPNFAYELCASKIPQAEREGLDLSHWQVALNGAEPIALSTLRKFSKVFQPHGFGDATFTGGYGLAEATMYVTCGQRYAAPTVLHLDKTALLQNRAVVREADALLSAPAVSSGRIQSEPLVRIVSPDTGRICEAGEIGEIWVSGESVCRAYWQRPAESIEVFAATLADEPGVAFLRTGDLGFIHDDELYVTGRIKDLLIIRGANHYPQDIEATVENVHADLRKGGWGAAFTLRDDVEEHLVVVQEVERSARRRIDAAETGAAIARAVSLQHGIDPHTVVFVAPGGVPKTSSGKIQRRTCRDLFLAGKLEELGRWERPSSSSIAAASAAALHPHAVQTRVREIAASVLYLAPSALPGDAAFSELGLDSVRIIEFVALISEAFGVDLAPSVAFDYPTIAALSAHLTGLNAGRAAAGPAGTDEQIAIIGMDCRFPGANGTEEFWQLLAAGRSAIQPVSAERQQLTGFGAEFEEADDAPYRFGGFLDGIQYFDAGLFGIAPREAHSIDPQQRLLLQTAWHALETANIPPDSLAGTATGVFVGVCASDYFNLQRDAGSLNAYSGTGNALSIAANRISYAFGLQGPSMAIDTACSSSLVAVHQACRSLARGESTLALVGGVNLILSADHGYIFSQANMLSPSGQCRTFDDGADGYVRGEGCGVVVLKKLADAVRDGDPVLAVIRGAAVSQDGHSNGLTSPNGLAQQRVITMALAQAGVPAASIAYVETHGTGTPLGDPIEVQALQAVLDASRQPDSPPCWLGAVKTSIGHLEPASGIAGLIKAVLVLNHQTVPPNRNFATLNRHLQFDTSRLAVPTALQEWPASADYPRRAGVSAFGFGGTNAHLVIEEYLAQPAPDEQTPLRLPPYFLALSAKNGDSLAQLAAAYAIRLAALEHDPLALRAVCRAGVSG
ncbi:MAG: beta-ketoacyl synthase N-terminal-like domain-containing protein, partial [Herbaspirillum sp.]